MILDLADENVSIGDDCASVFLILLVGPIAQPCMMAVIVGIDYLTLTRSTLSTLNID